MIAPAYPGVAALPAADLTRREHRFFICSTAAIALLVVIGFGFSTYVRTRPGADRVWRANAQAPRARSCVGVRWLDRAESVGGSNPQSLAYSEPERQVIAEDDGAGGQ